MKTADRARYAAVRDAARRVIGRGGGGSWELPAKGALHVERPIPFLAIVRLATDDEAIKLAGGLASRLVVPAEPSHAPGIAALAQAVSSALLERCGSLMVLWIGVGGEALELRIAPGRRWDALVDPIARALSNVRYDDRALELHTSRAFPEHTRIAWSDEVCELDLVIPAVFRGTLGTPLFPLWLEDLRRSLAASILAAADAFAAHAMPHADPRPRFGASLPDRAARACDRILCRAADAFEVLVQLTPAGLDAMWARLVETRFEEEPVLRYRPLPYDPVVLKRLVLRAPVEEIEDPFVAELMREKQEELDRLLSMLRDRGDRFLHDSEILFGCPDGALLDLCARILEAPCKRAGERELLDLPSILERTRAHMRSYRDQDPLFPDELELRTDIAAGLMVARGTLLLRPDVALSPRRLYALLEHEVGTHVLTWFNGSAQPLRIFGVGLAGYEALQEGLAVLAEHLAGALDPARIRVLAARVVAADAVVNGASFLTVFHALRALGIGEQAAFQTTVRALRGGGMTKDIAYLRGLCALIDHLRAGRPLEPLYAAKIALAHADMLAALTERGLVGPPRVLPSVLADRDARARLEALRRSPSAADAVLALARAA